MATLLTIREPDGAPFPLAVVEQHFADPSAVTIERSLDTGGLYALPGLADAHAHLSMTTMSDAGPLDEEAVVANCARHAWMQLEGGVLLVFDKGSGSPASLRILAADPRSRPELQMAGRIIAAPGGYYPFFAHEVDDAGLAAAVATAADAATWVKIIGDWPRRGEGPRANYTEAALRRAVQIVHAAGRRVAVHTMAPQVASLVTRTGVDSIEHGTFLTAEDLAAIAARDGAWVPTVAGVESIIAFLGPDSSGGRLLTKGLANLRDLLPEAERLGVTVLAGTDLSLPHGTVAREAIKLVEYGLSPTAAVAAVTTAAYEYAGIARGFLPGRPADAVFFRADPRDDPTTLLDPVLVLRRGRVVVDRR